MQHQRFLNQLSRHQPRLIQDNTKFAAVALLNYIDKNKRELFLIKRTVHPSDPWSGQIGLPGGRQEDHDRSLVDTAIRETHEETGIVLTKDNFIAQADDQQGYATGGKINLTVRPFIFLIESKPAVNLNHEVDACYWLPHEHFLDSTNHLYFKPMATFSKRPGVKLDESNILWGMTYRIITDFYNACGLVSPFVGDYDRAR